MRKFFRVYVLKGWQWFPGPPSHDQDGVASARPYLRHPHSFLANRLKSFQHSICMLSCIHEQIRVKLGLGKFALVEQAQQQLLFEIISC